MNQEYFKADISDETKWCSAKQLGKSAAIKGKTPQEKSRKWYVNYTIGKSGRKLWIKQDKTKKQSAGNDFSNRAGAFGL